MDDTETPKTESVTEPSLRDKLRQHDAARYFVMEAMEGLLKLIRETRPDWVLALQKGDKAEVVSLSGIELKDWNEEWVTTARSIIKELWASGSLMAADVTRVMEGLKEDSGRKK